MPRIARIFAINHPHHITQRGNNKQSVFLDDGDKAFYLKLITAYSQKWAFDIWAYCLMTNHVHLLVVPKAQKSLARGMGSTNLVYTQYFNKKYQRTGRLWQNRFFSTIIDRETYLWAAARYIERNPVRAGIVKDAQDYIWSSACAHLLSVENPILSSNGWLDKENVSAYRKFLQDAHMDMDGDTDIENAIRKATSTGKPLGGEKFIRIISEETQRELSQRKSGRPKKSG